MPLDGGLQQWVDHAIQGAQVEWVEDAVPVPAPAEWAVPIPEPARGPREPNMAPWVVDIPEAPEWIAIKKTDAYGWEYTLFEIRKEELPVVAKALMERAIKDGLGTR